MKTTTTVDRFGRVVLPKPLRDALDLEPGAVLDIEERQESIVLTPRRSAPAFELREGVLIYGGEVQGDLASAVRHHRDRTIARRSGLTEDATESKPDGEPR